MAERRGGAAVWTGVSLGLSEPPVLRAGAVRCGRGLPPRCRARSDAVPAGRRSG